jgi:transcriptional regulator NrdR family protein
MKHLVKRKGHTEEFDERKLYASLFAAVTSLRISDEEAETICHMVTHEVKDVIKDKKEVTAHLLHSEAAKILKKYQPDAAYLYSTHKDLS